MADAELFARYRDALDANAGLVRREVEKILADTANMSTQEAYAYVRRNYPKLVQVYGRVAADVARQYYQAQRDEYGFDDEYLAISRGGGDESWYLEDVANAYGQSSDGEEHALTTPDQLMGKAIQRVYERADYTLDQNMWSDPRDAQWAIVPHPGACGFCIMVGSNGFHYHSEASALAQRHTNCIVGDTEVSGPRIQAATRRKYKGVVVDVKTAGGRNVTVTPNHPVLTRNGWVAAGSLSKSDELLCSASVNREFVKVPNENHRPPKVEDLFSTLSFISRRSVVSVPCSAEDFHGDGIKNSEINIVDVDSLLTNVFNSVAVESINKCHFARGLGHSIGRALFNAKRMLDFLRVCFLTSPNGFVSIFRKRRALFFSHVRSTEDLSFFRRAENNPVAGKPSVDNRARYSAFLRYRKDTFSRVIGVSNPFRAWDDSMVRYFLDTRLVKSLSDHPTSGSIALCKVWDSLARVISSYNTGAFDPERTSGDSVFSKCRINNGSVDSSPLLYFKAGQSRLVEFDNVESVTFREFDGHVYNLQTSEGWYQANGIITHNCKCNVVCDFSDSPKLDGYDPMGLYDIYDTAYKNVRQDIDDSWAEMSHTERSKYERKHRSAKDVYRMKRITSEIDRLTGHKHE